MTTEAFPWLTATINKALNPDPDPQARVSPTRYPFTYAYDFVRSHADEFRAMDVLGAPLLREAKAKAPHLFTDRPMMGSDGVPVLYPMLYRCSHFDQETRRCGIYEDRPQPCRDYPRYGQPIVPGHAVLPETCSYRSEQGLRVTPVIMVATPVEIGPKPGC